MRVKTSATAFQTALTAAYAQLDAVDRRLRAAQQQFLTAVNRPNRRAAVRRVLHLTQALQRARKERSHA